MAFIYDLTDTWNAGGTTFNAIKMNVTDTASAAASKLITVQVSGSERFGVDKAGNVLIGNGGDLLLSSATGGNNTALYNDAQDLYIATNGSTRMYINSSGSVGIGTSSPSRKLHVNAGSANTALQIESTDAIVGLEFKDTAGTATISSSGDFRFSGTSGEVVRMESGGNVGIGTSSPGAKLDVRGVFSIGGAADASLHINTVYGGNGRLTQMSPSGTSVDAVNLIAAKDGGGSDLWYTWGVDTANQYRINQGVGFGANGMVLGNGYTWWYTTSTLDTVSYLPFQVKGGISIDTNTTAAASAMSFFNGQGSGTRVGWIGTSGSSTSYNTSSDQRLKENIADADDAGALIDTIQVRQFDWRLNGEHQAYGMVAQELDNVYPDAVSHGPTEDDMMAVDYSKLVPMLIKEIQSLRARVAQLEG